jgi:hypothetical protein
MEQDEEIRERVLREFNASTLDDVGPLTTLSGISLQSGTEDRSRLNYGTTSIVDPRAGTGHGI